MENHNILNRIEDRLAENKSSVKTYASYSTAHTVAENESNNFEKWNGTDVGMEYVVVMLPKTHRWTVIFNMSKWIQRANTGTYVGWFAQRGFFSI